jgi:hypothetical protein
MIFLQLTGWGPRATGDIMVRDEFRPGAAMKLWTGRKFQVERKFSDVRGIAGPYIRVAKSK